ncbi:hypothetical protein GDO86_000974 [Hymenochirus boettgeri]|uniref:Exonuclease domain-containing protein n=1 Tax=Hymenochirus boettgeri TaxID=247094 RepID=A0A8T2KAR4_9PIPI|nr:hypothetical protein GDO86_000974 [Hymenochirus boettgeri]
MLKSTGYFRGLECPFRESCRRPYCHFRHRGRAAGSIVTGEAQVGAEYDPCSPAFPTVPPSLENDLLGVVLDPNLDILELERVNRAIEAVKNEVEREQKKYKEFLETKKDHNASYCSRSQVESFSPLAYDPGSCSSDAIDYNPTPLAQAGKVSCKYTLNDCEGESSKSKPMEYVPAVVAPVFKVSTNKYVIDTSKPHTDLEYDPMSNYSARLLNKVKEQKGTKRRRLISQEEDQSVTEKKVCRKTSVSIDEARFSDSEEETKSQSIPGKSKEKFPKPNKENYFDKKEKRIHKVKEMAVQYSVEDIGQPAIISRKVTAKISSKVCGFDKEKREDSKKSKNMVSSKGSSVKDKKSLNVVKAKSDACANNKLHKKGVALIQKRDSDKSGKGKSDIQKSDRDQVKNSLDVNKKERVGKSLKNIDKGVKCEVKNGKVKDNTVNCKTDKLKSSATGKFKAKPKQKSLSHVDLFGDDSSEEDLKDKKEKPSDIIRRGSRKSLSYDNEEHLIAKSSKDILKKPLVCSVDLADIDYSLLEKDMDSDSDPMEECLRVFNESQDVKTEDKGRMGKQLYADKEDKSEQELTTLLPGQKRRISHVTTPTNADSIKPKINEFCRPTPQEICYLRIQKAQEQAVQLLAQQQVIQLASSAQKNALSQPGEKKRIAHVPGLPSPPSLVLTTELKKQSSGGKSLTSNGLSSSLKTRTASGMTSKTTTTSLQKRQAHVPSLQSASMKRPVIPTEFGAKVPTTVRQRYLNLFIDECLKLCPTQQEAFEKALVEEKFVYGRSSSRNIYLNVAVNTLKKLRSQGPSNNLSTTKSLNKKAVSHESVLGGRLAAKTSFSVQRNIGQREENLTGKVLYEKLKNYLLTAEQMQENGYPVAHPDKPGNILISFSEEKRGLDSFCRVCCRCGAEYIVSPSGNCVRVEECIHHWGRLRRIKGPGGWDTQYSCCSGAVGSAGCQVGKQHVHDGKKENLDSFVKTLEKPPPEDGSPGVFALDCEMCYTTRGLELTRVTVINSNLKVVYDTFVKPDSKIVDYNTRFSGVTEEDLQNTTITVRDVQAVLLCMFSSETILIGHSLESDLFALKLIHPMVVDTAIVFPHRLGLPYKRALRSLMADHLKRIIQDNVEGHDSSEDACSCMELMIWKIKEDAKVKR